MVARVIQKLIFNDFMVNQQQIKGEYFWELNKQKITNFHNQYQTQKSPMGRIFKTGRVVILTAGRFAGQKAIVAKNYEDGTKKHRFPHLLIVGIARNPRSVKRSINKKKFIKRTGVKSFIKVVNQNHVIPTRFVVNDFDLKDVKEDNIKTLEARTALKKQWRTTLSTTYRNLPDPKTNEKAPHVRFFYSKLRF